MSWYLVYRINSSSQQRSFTWKSKHLHFADNIRIFDLPLEPKLFQMSNVNVECFTCWKFTLFYYVDEDGDTYLLPAWSSLILLSHDTLFAKDWYISGGSSLIQLIQYTYFSYVLITHRIDTNSGYKRIPCLGLANLWINVDPPIHICNIVA